MQNTGIDKKLKKSIRGCVITFALLIVMLYIKNEYSEVLLRNATYGMPALIKKGHVDNLFIGSSAFRQGLSIDVLNDNLNGENYILTYNGNEPFLELLELEKLIENGVDIKHVYIDMYAYSIDRAPKLDDEKLLIELNLSEKNQLYNTLGEKSANTWWQLFVSSNNEMLLTWPIYKNVIDSKFRDGGTLIDSPSMYEKSYEAVNALYSDGEINSVQREAIEHIIKLSKDKGFELTFVEIPKAQNIMNDQQYSIIMSEYERLLSETEVEYIRSNITNLAYSDYSDGIHLSSSGRKKYTIWLVNRIKNIL